MNNLLFAMLKALSLALKTANANPVMFYFKDKDSLKAENEENNPKYRGEIIDRSYSVFGISDRFNRNNREFCTEPFFKNPTSLLTKDIFLNAASFATGCKVDAIDAPMFYGMLLLAKALDLKKENTTRFVKNLVEEGIIKCSNTHSSPEISSLIRLLKPCQDYVREMIREFLLHYNVKSYVCNGQLIIGNYTTNELIKNNDFWRRTPRMNEECRDFTDVIVRTDIKVGPKPALGLQDAPRFKFGLLTLMRMLSGGEHAIPANWVDFKVDGVHMLYLFEQGINEREEFKTPKIVGITSMDDKSNVADDAYRTICLFNKHISFLEITFGHSSEELGPMNEASEKAMLSRLRTHLANVKACLTNIKRVRLTIVGPACKIIDEILDAFKNVHIENLCLQDVPEDWQEEAYDAISTFEIPEIPDVPSASASENSGNQSANELSIEGSEGTIEHLTFCPLNHENEDPDLIIFVLKILNEKSNLKSLSIKLSDVLCMTLDGILIAGIENLVIDISSLTSESQVLLTNFLAELPHKMKKLKNLTIIASSKHKNYLLDPTRCIERTQGLGLACESSPENTFVVKVDSENVKMPLSIKRVL